MDSDHHTQCPHCGGPVVNACEECNGQGFVVDHRGGAFWACVTQRPCSRGCPLPYAANVFTAYGSWMQSVAS